MFITFYLTFWLFTSTCSSPPRWTQWFWQGVIFVFASCTARSSLASTPAQEQGMKGGMAAIHLSLGLLT